MRPRLSRARSRAAGAPWSCSKGDRSCRSASRSSGRDRRASRREPPSTTGSGPREARLGEFHLLRRGQPPRRSAPRPAPRPVPRPVPEPGQAFGVVAQHRVPQRRALHAREACRVRPAQTVERMGDRVHSRRRPTALLTTGRPPNAVGRQLPPDLQRSSHDHPRIPASPHPRIPASPQEQNHAALSDRTPRVRSWPRRYEGRRMTSSVFGTGPRAAPFKAAFSHGAARPRLRRALGRASERRERPSGVGPARPPSRPFPRPPRAS